MSLFTKINVRLILIAMVFALAPTATYAAAYIKFDGISAKKMPRMRVTDETTVHEVAVFAARHAGVDVGCINLSWRGRVLWRANGDGMAGGQRLLGSYNMLGEANVQHGYTEVEWTYVTFRGCSIDRAQFETQEKE